MADVNVDVTEKVFDDPFHRRTNGKYSITFEIAFNAKLETRSVELLDRDDHRVNNNNNKYIYVHVARCLG